MQVDEITKTHEDDEYDYYEILCQDGSRLYASKKKTILGEQEKKDDSYADATTSLSSSQVGHH